MAKSKNKKEIKQVRKEAANLIAATQKETRLDTLRGIRQMMVHGITIDVAALNVMIEEVGNATTPIENFNKEFLDKLNPSGEDVWAPEADPDYSQVTVPKVPTEEQRVDPNNYTVEMMADNWGVSRQTITKFLRDNFPSFAPGGGSQWRITTEMVDAVSKRWS